MTSSLPTPVIETERFMMRPLVREDAPAFFPTLGDPAQCRYLLQPAFESLEALEGWLCDPSWNGRSWSAIDRANGAIAARVVAVPGEDRISEIGFITVAQRQGEGIAFECAQALVDHLFANENHHRLTGGADPRNGASNAVLAKLGFMREAHLRQSVRTHEGWCDEYLWGLLASDWRARSG